MNQPLVAKSEFSIFSGDPHTVYLNSAATTLVPQSVVDAMVSHLGGDGGAVGGRATGVVSDPIPEARNAVASLMSTDAEGIVFTGGATLASNMLTYALEHTQRFLPGERIVTSVAEHHASLIPLQQLAQRTGMKLDLIPLDGASLDMAEAQHLIRQPGVRLVSIMGASNVVGTLFDLATLTGWAHDVGAYMVSDLTACAGHLPLLPAELDLDGAYFSGHKMHGPTGVGVLYLGPRLRDGLEPGFYGGGIVRKVTSDGAVWRDAPERFEPGTPPVTSIVGLREASLKLAGIGLENVSAHVRAIQREAHDALSSLDGVQVVSQRDSEMNVGITTFLVQGAHPHDVAEILSRHRITVRAGYHCAEPLHHALGIGPTVRASFYTYNTSSDVETLRRAVLEAVQILT